MSQIRDNIATPLAPVWRTRRLLPLTPQAIRYEQLSDGTLHRTPLDLLLDDAQAQALEHYAWCEELLQGSARCADYSGDRVQSTRLAMAPLTPVQLQQLHEHAYIKRRLHGATLRVLALFSAQQSADPAARSDAQLGIVFYPNARDKSAAWRERVAAAAAELVRLFQ